MDTQNYLKSYGWKEGEALQKGGIKKPILVKHKNDKKGVGHQPSGGADAWWERLFDGQLKALDVSNNAGEVSFKQDKFVASGLAVSDSPLYRMFVRGETLGGTVGKVEILEINRDSTGLATTDFTQIKTSFEDGSARSKRVDGKVKQKGKKDKSDKRDKSKMVKSEKKEKKDKAQKESKSKKVKSLKIKEVKEKKDKDAKKERRDRERVSRKRATDNDEEQLKKKTKKVKK